MLSVPEGGKDADVIKSRGAGHISADRILPLHGADQCSVELRAETNEEAWAWVRRIENAQRQIGAGAGAGVATAHWNPVQAPVAPPQVPISAAAAMQSPPAVLAAQRQLSEEYGLAADGSAAAAGAGAIPSYAFGRNPSFSHDLPRSRGNGSGHNGGSGSSSSNTI